MEEVVPQAGRHIPWPVDMLLPHARTMLLLDRARCYGDGWAEAEVRIAEDSLFYEIGRGVPSWVGIEYMAQTVAMYDGIRSQLERKPISLGLLVGTRRFTASSPWFPLGDLLTVRVEQELLDGPAGVFHCRIEGHSVWAECRLNVFVPSDRKAFFEEDLP
ncbi:3-hydroxylacyl-ACP dehydratase [Oleisolibacter albus]|uniref:ApeP family dehydratase n=1 Tax=Oleisolibacter albus TaxID=2171757 RepID=UPI000DF2E4FB|nr:3-hydroxylacyl-ACP dehydratase [Oleisolibacter albus]